MIRRIICVLAFVCISTTTASATMGAKRFDFVPTVTATHPLAFFRFEGLTGTSAVGTATYKSVAGVSATAVGAPIGVHGNHALMFNGVDGYVDTTHLGGIGSAGSMMAWVKLEKLPADLGHIDYLCGESQSGNDFDLQFESDNRLHFYTAAGSNVSYLPDSTTLIDAWHMIVVTVDFAKGARAIYWDGKLVASDNGGGNQDKTTEFSVGASKVFSGRYFDGGIDEVAIWNRALSASEVATIYDSSTRNNSR
jgi:hypothetical protein